MGQCGILIICHAPLGQSLLSVVRHIIGNIPEHVRSLDVSAESSRDDEVENALHILEELDEGEGVLLISDIKGATPGNIAARLHTMNPRSSLVYGINLPMLLRAINYRSQHHNEVAKAAICGAERGILMDKPVHD